MCNNLLIMMLLLFSLSVLLSFVAGYIVKKYFDSKKPVCNWEITFNAIQDPLSIIDKDGKFVHANEAMLKLFNTSKDKIQEFFCHDIMHGKAFHIEGCPLLRSKQSYQREEMELVLGEKTFIVSVDPIFRDGKLIEFVHIMKDITEIKTIQNKMNEETRKFVTLVDNLPGFVYRCANDRNWTMQYISQGCEIITGYSPEEFINNAVISFNDIIAPEYQDYLWNKWQDVLSRKDYFEDEYEIITKTGERRWVWERGRGIYDEQGHLKFLEGFITDVTDRKNLLHALIESEEKFKNLATATTASIFVYQDTRFVYLNPATEQITGYSQEELLQMNFWDLVHPDHREMVKDRGLRRQKGEPLPNTYDFKIIRKDGEVRWVKFSGASLSSYKGRPAAIATVFDITDIIETQNKLQEIISQLEESERQLTVQNEEYISLNEELKQTNQRIQRLNEELIKAKEKAEASDRLKTTFLNNISHEIRTPLNAILGFSDLMAKRLPQDEKLKQYVSIVQASGKHLLNVITNIINAATIEAGEEKVLYQKVNLNQLAETAINSLKPFLIKKDVQLILHKLPNEQAFLITDETKMNQILINLLNNAIKFTEKGSIELTLSVKDNQLLITVADTGIGISQEMLPYIFERFIQDEDVFIKKKESGMGLGLSIVKSYVKLMGGDISVHSEIEKGTTFIINLPYMPIDIHIQGKDEVSVQIAADFADGKKILIAEDMENNAALIKEYLSPYNINLLFAQNGYEAIELVKENPDISVILMDIKMPEMDGYEACRQISKINPSIPIIGLSAYSQEDDHNKMISCGMRGCLTKPILKDELIKILRKYL